MPDEYQIKVPQLHLLRDCLVRFDYDVTKGVENFVTDYVHKDKKEIEFWTPIAEKIKADPDYVEKFSDELKTKNGRNEPHDQGHIDNS